MNYHHHERKNVSRILLFQELSSNLVYNQLPRATPDRPQAIKYRLYFGRGGKGLVRYDNETGKGDHRYVRGKETPYHFVSLAKLRRDFESDMRKYGGEDEEEDSGIAW
jgi:hypothetical protein